MGYRIWSEKEKAEFLSLNKSDIIKSSIEFAIAVSVSFASLKVLNSMPTEEMIYRITGVVGSLGVIGLDFHSIMKLCFSILERDRIENNYTVLYDKEDLKSRRM